MRRIRWGRFGFLALVVAPSLVMAHGGNHEPPDGGGLVHVLTQADHLLVVVLAGAGVVAVTRLFGGKRRNGRDAEAAAVVVPGDSDAR